MSKNYDLIATIDIDVNQPLVDTTAYGTLLIVGPAPAVAPATAPAAVGEYASLDEVIAAGWVESGNGADPVGVAARIAFAQKPTPKKIVIAPIQVKNEEAEDPLDTVKRAVDQGNWYILTLAGVAENKYQSIANYIETTEKMFWYTETAVFGNSGTIVKGELYKTHAILGLESSTQTVAQMADGNKYIAVAAATVLLGYQSGSETACFKQLTGVNAGNYSGTEITALKSANVSYYIPLASKNVTMGGKVLGGEWCDVIRFRDWLKNDMQVRVVDVFVSNPKISLNDAGIALIQNQMLASLKAGQDNGGIPQDEYDADGNLVAAYETSVPIAADLTPEERATRSLRDFTFKARLAGAIHFVAIEGSLSNSL